MAMKVEIVSKDTIKPSSPTPNHLRHFKLSLLDEFAPPVYVPILLFYSASNVTAFGTGFNAVSDKLKTSLSEVLTLYYPFCGRQKGNSTIECNDEGALFIESKVPIELSCIMKNPQLHDINALFPCDPYNPKEEQRETLGNMAIQLNQFKCGGIVLGVCLSHKIADGSTTALILNAWAATSRGQGTENLVPHRMEEAAMLFPPMNMELDITRGMVVHENIVSKRFVFNAISISRLTQNIKCSNFNPTRVEAVTTLIWKSLLEATKANSRDGKFPASMVCHAVNIRSRMTPALSEHSIGNLWQAAISSLVEVKVEVGLHDLAKRVRETIGKVDEDYISKLQGVDQFPMILASMEETRILIAEKGIPCYGFTSWTRFGFYEVDFGWGRPTYVRTIGVPMKNVIILMATKDGDGIEAWVTLTTHAFITQPILCALHISGLDWHDLENKESGLRTELLQHFADDDSSSHQLLVWLSSQVRIWYPAASTCSTPVNVIMKLFTMS